MLLDEVLGLSAGAVDPFVEVPGKGQVERQVGDVRGRLFVPSPRGSSYAEINEWLMDRCIEDARTHPHPTIPGKTVQNTRRRVKPEDEVTTTLVSS